MYIFSIPSPPYAVWYIGPVPLKAYSIAILVGIFLCVYWCAKRYKERGGKIDDLLDLTLWAVIFGIIGARTLFVITMWQYFFVGPGEPWQALAVWQGGLEIYGGVIGGGIAVCVWLRKHNLKIAPLADALAPCLLIAQAVGRIGNYFNQEVFGQPTTLPWGLQIDLQHRPPGFEAYATFQPTFLYEMIWNIFVAILIVTVGQRIATAGGQLFAFYICGYSLGRGFIEMIRIDQSSIVLGLRWHVWLAIVTFIFGLITFWYCRQERYPFVQEKIEDEPLAKQATENGCQSVQECPQAQLMQE